VAEVVAEVEVEVEVEVAEVAEVVAGAGAVELAGVAEVQGPAEAGEAPAQEVVVQVVAELAPGEVAASRRARSRA
jgi:hypothetical protein